MQPSLTPHEPNPPTHQHADPLACLQVGPERGAAVEGRPRPHRLGQLCHRPRRLHPGRPGVVQREAQPGQRRGQPVSPCPPPPPAACLCYCARACTPPHRMCTAQHMCSRAFLTKTSGVGKRWTCCPARCMPPTPGTGQRRASCTAHPSHPAHLQGRRVAQPVVELRRRGAHPRPRCQLAAPAPGAPLAALPRSALHLLRLPQLPCAPRSRRVLTAPPATPLPHLGADAQPDDCAAGGPRGADDQHGG